MSVQHRILRPTDELLARTLTEIIQAGRDLGMQDAFEKIVAEITPPIATSSLPIDRYGTYGVSFYDLWNLCTMCRRPYPKIMRSCPIDRQLLRSRPRS